MRAVNTEIFFFPFLLISQKQKYFSEVPKRKLLSGGGGNWGNDVLLEDANSFCAKVSLC